jgi:UDP-N-acetylglucosamine 2-epimerase (non-hydrolysing)
MTGPVLLVIGTRPEAIKLAPVFARLREDGRLPTRLVLTGQHRDLVDDVLPTFGLAPDDDLAAMTEDQSLAGLTARLLTGLDAIMAREPPLAVLVQGDTTSALTAALAAFYRKIPVGHVEAGLRTGDRFAPFPEEINRRLIADLATWHFAPTLRARDALLREGVAEADVLVTGNTVVDALRRVLDHVPAPADELPRPGRRLLLVTAHRRESHGPPLDALCRALRRLADAHPDLDVCFPVHPNPRVRASVDRALVGHPRIALRPPMAYAAFVHLLARADVVLTDSGGVQEEAATLGIPTLVARDITERVEAVAERRTELVGTDEETIVVRVAAQLAQPRRSSSSAIYGDGQASLRIVDFLVANIMERRS